MKRYTETVVDWMIRQKVINEKEKELYGYALYSVGLLILPLLFAVGIGFILGSIKSGIALVVPFMILRKYSGGYHAKTFSHCAIGSILLLFLCIKFSMQIKCDWKLLFVTVIASVSLIKFSPMDHEAGGWMKQRNTDIKNRNWFGAHIRHVMYHFIYTGIS